MTQAALMHAPDLRDSFRNAIRRVASTVFVVTTRVPEGNAGITATAVCSLSFDPLSVLVCVNRSSAFLPAVEASGRFAINALSQEDESIANAFGNPAGREQRFTRGEWYELDGMPALRSSLSTIACRVAGCMDFGSHRVLAGEVTGVDIREGGSELLYCQGEYRSLKPRSWRNVHWADEVCDVADAW